MYLDSNHIQILTLIFIGKQYTDSETEVINFPAQEYYLELQSNIGETPLLLLYDVANLISSIFIRCIALVLSEMQHFYFNITF